MRAAQYYPEIHREYAQLIRRKGKAIARALIAKELGSIVYHVLTRQEAFNGRFRGLQLTRTKPRRWPRLASPPASLAPLSVRTSDWEARRHVGREHLSLRARRSV